MTGSVTPTLSRRLRVALKALGCHNVVQLGVARGALSDYALDEFEGLRLLVAGAALSGSVKDEKRLRVADDVLKGKMVIDFPVYVNIKLPDNMAGGKLCLQDLIAIEEQAHMGIFKALEERRKAGELI